MKSFGLVFTLFISNVSITISQTIPRIVNYTLVNAETNQDIFDFTANASFEDSDIVVLDLTGLAHPERINIRVNTDPPVVDRVDFGLDGDDYGHTETIPPYALFGDNNGNYKSWQQALFRTIGGSCATGSGYHWCWVSVTNNGQEVSTFFNFNVKYDDIRVTSFTLVNAVTDQDIFDLHEGDVIDLSALPTNKLNIRANTVPPTVGSVWFNGQIENIAPYALYGDRNGNYNVWQAAPGEYGVSATPYSQAGTLPGRGLEPKGVCGIPLSISFQFIQSGTHKTGAEINGEHVASDLELYPNPNEGVFNVAFSMEETSNVKVEVFDMFGKTVFHEELLSFSGAYQRQLDLSLYPQGIYLLRVDDGERTRVRKIVISER